MSYKKNKNISMIKCTIVIKNISTPARHETVNVNRIFSIYIYM